MVPREKLILMHLWVRRYRKLSKQHHIQQHRKLKSKTLNNKYSVSQNGASGFLFGLGRLLYGSLSLFYLLKLVSLGHRIVPGKHLRSLASYGDKLSKLTPIGRYWFLMCIVGLAGGHSYLWIRRFRNLQAKQGTKKINATRVPLVPFMSWLLFFVYLVFIPITSTNNSSKGASTFLYGFGLVDLRHI